VTPGRIALLQAMPIFGALRDDTLDALLEGAATAARDAGAFYFREGDEALCMYVIEAGAVEVRKRWGDQERPLQRLRAGDCFGEMALMDLFPRSASVCAVEPTRAIEITPAALQRLAERDLEQFALLQMNLGREVSRRLRATDELLFRLRRGEAAAPADFGPTLI
jgi:CRP/FNR family transcriptional regulator, cyclic AMP receptor protein